MTGPIRSEWAKFASPYSAQTWGNVFSWVAQYFDNHPGYIRIASNYGLSGSGFGFQPYQTDYPRGGAFGVWRNVSSSLQTGIAGEPEGVPCFDFAMTLGDNSAFMDYTSSWLPASQPGVWYTIAWHSSSAAWNGTTANNGQDVWTTTPWKSGSISLCRTNGSGAFASASLSSLTRLDSTDNLPPSDALITGDNDTTCIAFRTPNVLNSEFSIVNVFGGYQRFTGSCDVPLVLLKMDATWAGPWRQAGTLFPAYYDQGIATKSTIGVKKLNVEYPNSFTREFSDTSGETTKLAYDFYTEPDIQDRYVLEWPILVAAGEWNGGSALNESFVGSHFVMGGYLPNIRVVGINGIIARYYNNYSRVVLGFSSGGGNGTYDVALSIPWNSGSILYRTY